MMTETAIVIHYAAGKATVKCQAQSACGGCAARSACGTAALSELTGERGEHLFTVDTLTPVKAGQRVEIGLEEGSLMVSALWLYAVPLLTLLIAAVAAEALFQNELAGALFIFASTAAAFLAVKYVTQKIYKKSAFKPILLRVLS